MKQSIQFFRASRFYLLSIKPPERDRIDISKDFLKEWTKGVGVRIRLGHVERATAKLKIRK